MNKLKSLRNYIMASCPDLKKNPDKLLTFAEEGQGEARPRNPSLSFKYVYTATLILTDFSDHPDTVVIPILKWLHQNQPDRADVQFLRFNAEILGNDAVDLEIKVDLTETVIVTNNDDGTVSTSHIGEPIYLPEFSETGDPLRQWELGQTNG